MCIAPVSYWLVLSKALIGRAFPSRIGDGIKVLSKPILVRGFDIS